MSKAEQGGANHKVLGVVTEMPCKICEDGVATPKFCLAEYDVLECPKCGFRQIAYLDGETEASKPVTEELIQRNIEYARTHLEGSAQRLAGQVALTKSRAKEGATILDVGCCGGAFLLGLGDSYERIGIELSPVWLEISRRNGITLVGEPVGSDYWDAYIGKFDVVTMWDVIEHVNYPREVVARLLQLLKPSGLLLLDTPNRDGLYYRLGELTTRVSSGRHPTLLGIQYSPTPYDHKQIFRGFDIERLLKNSGFGEIQIERRSELSLPISLYLQQLTRSAAAARILSGAVKAILAMMRPQNQIIAFATKPTA